MMLIEHAYRYIEALAWGGAVTWQTFDDSPQKRPCLAKVMHGFLAEQRKELERLNDAGAGIFVTVNETDMNGRRADNIRRIRALFTDDDGDGNRDWPVTPSFVVHSASGLHAYWLISGSEGLAAFSDAQKRLALHLNTDPKVTDKPRVMRCPGFYHRKAEPVAVTFEPMNIAKRYTIKEVVGGLPPLPRSQRARVSKAPEQAGEWWCRLSRPIPMGSRNEELFKIACAMRGKGMGEPEISQAISNVNARLCAEPLDEAEVLAIARSAGKY